MKAQKLSVYIAVLCLFAATAHAQSYPFVIKGKLNDLSPMPVKIYLSSLVKGVLGKDIDSAEVKSGEYRFDGKIFVDEAIAVTLTADSKEIKGNNVLGLYIDKGELNVTSNGLFKQITISGSGSLAQQEHQAILNGIEKEKEELKSIVASDAYKTDPKIQADVLQRSRALSVKGLFDMYSYIKNNPDHRSSPFTTYAILSSGLMSQAAQDTLFQLLPAQVKADRLGREIAHIQIRKDSLLNVAKAKQAEEAGKVPLGSKAPDFTQLDANNKRVSLSAFKGKYVLIDFWASWCMPCRAENPNVVKAYNRYKDKGFTVLGVSLDSQSARAAWLKAIAADGLVWTQVSDLKGWKNEAADTYGVSSIPQNFLIDPNGVVIGKNLRGEDLNTRLASIFK